MLDAVRLPRTGRAVDPLVRSATTFVARRPLWGLTIGVATAVLALAASTAPLVTEAAADRAFHQEALAAVGSPPGTGIDARASTTGLADAAAAAAVAARLDALDVYGSPTMSVRPIRPYSGFRHPMPLVAAGDVRATGVVYALGDTVSTLRTIGDTAPAPGAVWLPDTLAAELGVSAGDSVELALVAQLTDADLAAGALPPEQQPLDGIDVDVAGVYLTEDGLPVSDGFDWQSIAQQLPPHPELVGRTAPLVLTDTTTAMTVLDEMGDNPFVIWDAAWEGPTTISRGRDAAGSLADASEDFADSHSRIGSLVEGASADDVVLASSEPDFVQRSDEGAAILDPVLDSIALAALLVAVLVLATCVWLLVASRRRETMLSLARGESPTRVASIVLVELLPALIVGVVAAYAIVRWAPGLVAGDGSIGPHTAGTARRWVIACLPVAVLVVFAVALSTAWIIDPATADRAKRWLSVLRPETIAVVAAAANGRAGVDAGRLAARQWRRVAVPSALPDRRRAGRGAGAGVGDPWRKTSVAPPGSDITPATIALAVARAATADLGTHAGEHGGDRRRDRRRRLHIHDGGVGQRPSSGVRQGGRDRWCALDRRGRRLGGNHARATPRSDDPAPARPCSGRPTRTSGRTSPATY